MTPALSAYLTYRDGQTPDRRTVSQPFCSSYQSIITVGEFERTFPMELSFRPGPGQDRSALILGPVARAIDGNLLPLAATLLALSSKAGVPEVYSCKARRWLSGEPAQQPGHSLARD